MEAAEAFALYFRGIAMETKGKYTREIIYDIASIISFPFPNILDYCKKKGILIDESDAINYYIDLSYEHAVGGFELL